MKFYTNDNRIHEKPSLYLHLIWSNILLTFYLNEKYAPFLLGIFKEYSKINLETKILGRSKNQK